MRQVRSNKQGSKEKKSGRGDSSGKTWTFFTNHAHVLILLAMDGDLRLREMAERVGITERAVQKILSELSDAGFLRAERVGRENRYKLYLDRPLRHPIERHKTVAEIIKIIRL